MQVRFGLYSWDIENGVRDGLKAFSHYSNALPVSLQPNDQFTRLDQKLDRIATAVEKMASHYSGV